MTDLQATDFEVVVFLRNHHCNSFVPAREAVASDSSEVEKGEANLTFRLLEKVIEIVVGKRNKCFIVSKVSLGRACNCRLFPFTKVFDELRHKELGLTR